MKKLLILIMLFATLGVVGQGTWEIGNRTVQTIPAYTMDGDTSWIFNTTTAYIMQFGYDWTGVDATDATINVWFSNNGGRSYALSTYDAITINPTDTTKIYQDTEWVLADKVKIVYTNSSNTTGELTLNLRFIKR